MRAVLPSLAILAAPAAAAAQAPAIRDNSFLLEEAYNQEAGVVQHAALLHHAGGGAGWQVTFSQEWPLGSQRHQLSFSMPFASGSGGSGLGDLGVHYRYQLLGGGDEPLALSPRLSVFVPTGSPVKGTGAGSIGLQAGLPASVTLGPRFAAHLNAAFTLTPSSENPVGGTATAFDLGAGASLIWLAAPWMNVLVEGIWARTEEVVGAGVTAGRDEAFLSPGLRFAWNLPGGQQLVPGIAYAVGIGPSGGDEPLVLVYLSFEHAFGRRLTAPEAAAQLGLHPSRQVR
jgi:hypothetical protein